MKLWFLAGELTASDINVLPQGQGPWQGEVALGEQHQQNARSAEKNCSEKRESALDGQRDKGEVQK
jgi:hypothetical protein